jgi:hypothetical protein
MGRPRTETRVGVLLRRTEKAGCLQVAVACVCQKSWPPNGTGGSLRGCQPLTLAAGRRRSNASLARFGRDGRAVAGLRSVSGTLTRGWRWGRFPFTGLRSFVGTASDSGECGAMRKGLGLSAFVMDNGLEVERRSSVLRVPTKRGPPCCGKRGQAPWRRGSAYIVLGYATEPVPIFRLAVVRQRAGVRTGWRRKVIRQLSQNRDRHLERGSQSRFWEAERGFEGGRRLAGQALRFSRLRPLLTHCRGQRGRSHFR